MKVVEVERALNEEVRINFGGMEDEWVKSSSSLQE